MKGMVFDIRSFSVHDGPGIRTSFFLKGCPLRCHWCHNPESHSFDQETHDYSERLGNKFLQRKKIIGTVMDVSEVIDIALADRSFFEESGGGITLTGGEPLSQPSFVKAILVAAQEWDIHTALDTSGFATERIFDEVVASASLVLFDLKIADDRLHMFYTGQGNHLILNNLKRLSQRAIPIIIRIPLIPKITDTVENLFSLREIIYNTTNIQRIDLLPFHQLAFAKYKRMGREFGFEHNHQYPLEQLLQFEQYFQETGHMISIGA